MENLEETSTDQPSFCQAFTGGQECPPSFSFFPSSPGLPPATVAGVMGTLNQFVAVLVCLWAGISSVCGQDRPLPPPSAELKGLEWMLGSWTHEAEGVVLE